MLPQRAQRRASSDAGGQAVVGEDDLPTLHVGQRATAPVHGDAPLEFAVLRMGHRRQLRGVEAELGGLRAEDDLVEALGDRGDPVLGEAGNADLPRDERLRRHAEPRGDLPRDRNPAARQAQDHRRAQIQPRHAVREQSTRLEPVREARGELGFVAHHTPPPSPPCAFSAETGAEDHFVTSSSGDLVLPDGARTVVAFAHGTGSSRHSPRNRAVARVLQEAGLGTLLLDLLTEREEKSDAELRFDIPLLGRRMIAAVDWLDAHPATRGMPLGLFGASTGAAAALIAAAERPDRISAVVARGGRVDMAGDAIMSVRAPVLLIVGGHDEEVLELNRAVAARLVAPHRLEVIPGATLLFAEDNALETVARSARDWFLRPDPALFHAGG